MNTKNDSRTKESRVSSFGKMAGNQTSSSEAMELYFSKARIRPVRIQVCDICFYADTCA